MATCRLCLKDKQLIKSHIIPDFMYQGLFDDKHKLISFNPLELATGQARLKRPSSGEYESGLLCSECDTNIIGVYETYSSKASYGGLLRQDECPVCENFVNIEGLRYTLCKNIDYTKYKLFLLSILWRASISSRPLFKDINLGDHEEPIREMLINCSPGDIAEYPIISLTYRTDATMPIDVIGYPQQRETKEGHTTFVFLIAGSIYVYYMNSKDKKISDFVLSQTIKPTNELNILHLPDGSAWDFFKGFHGLTKKPNP